MSGGIMNYITGGLKTLGGGAATAFGGPIGATMGIPMMTSGVGELAGQGAGGNAGSVIGGDVGGMAGSLGAGQTLSPDLIAKLVAQNPALSAAGLNGATLTPPGGQSQNFLKMLGVGNVSDLLGASALGAGMAAKNQAQPPRMPQAPNFRPGGFGNPGGAQTIGGAGNPMSPNMVKPPIPPNAQFLQALGFTL